MALPVLIHPLPSKQAAEQGKDPGNETGRWITVGEGADAHHLYLPHGGFEQLHHEALRSGETHHVVVGGNGLATDNVPSVGQTFFHAGSGQYLTTVRTDSHRIGRSGDPVYRPEGLLQKHTVAYHGYARPATDEEAAPHKAEEAARAKLGVVADLTDKLKQRFRKTGTLLGEHESLDPAGFGVSETKRPLATPSWDSARWNPRAKDRYDDFMASPTRVMFYDSRTTKRHVLPATPELSEHINHINAITNQAERELHIARSDQRTGAKQRVLSLLRQAKDYAFGPDDGHWVTIDGEHVLLRGPRRGDPERVHKGSPEHLAEVGKMVNERQRIVRPVVDGSGNLVVQARIPFEDTGERQKLKDSGFKWNLAAKHWEKGLPPAYSQADRDSRANAIKDLVARDYGVEESHLGPSTTHKLLGANGVDSTEASVVRYGGDHQWHVVPHAELLGTAPSTRAQVRDMQAPTPAVPVPSPAPAVPTTAPERHMWTQPEDRLPFLVGSERQIRWANDIRRQHLNSLNQEHQFQRDSEHAQRTAGTLSDSDAAAHEGQRRGLRNWLAGQQQAGQWIDRREWSPEQHKNRYEQLQREGKVKVPKPVMPEMATTATKTAPVPALEPAKAPGTQEVTRSGDYRDDGPKVGDVIYSKSRGGYYTVSKVHPSTYIREDGMSFGLDRDTGWLHHFEMRPSTDEESAPQRAEAERSQTHAAAQLRATTVLRGIDSHPDAKSIPEHLQSSYRYAPAETIFEDKDRFGNGHRVTAADGTLMHYQSMYDMPSLLHVVPHNQDTADELRALDATLKRTKDPNRFTEGGGMPTRRTAELDTKERDDLPNHEFAYIDHHGVGHLPIPDAEHVREALARFNQEHFEDDVCKERARKAILAAAVKFGVDVSKDDPVAKAATQPTAQSVHVNAPIGAIKTKPQVDMDMDDDDGDDDDTEYQDSDDEDDRDDATKSKGKRVNTTTADDGDEEAETKAAERPTRAFLTKLRELLGGKVSPADLTEAVNYARAHAGGKGKAARTMTAGELADLCARGGPARLFTDTGSLATAPEWIPYLPKPGEYQHPQWGKLTITKERNQRFIDNFTNHVYQDQLPLDAEHETKLSGALGWVKGMRMNGDGSADAQVEWTDRGRTLLAQKRFRYVSPEWYDKWQAPDTGKQHQDVAIGGALTTRPFFKGDSLRPLVATEHGLATPDVWEAPDPTTIVFVELAPASVTGNGKDPQMSEQDQSSDQRRFTELEAKLAAEQAARTANEAALKQATEKLAAMEHTSRRKRFTDEVLGKSEDSNLRWFGEPQKHVTLLEKLADTFGESSDEVTQYIEQNRTTAEAIRSSNLFREIGSDATATGNSAEAELDALAKQHAEKHNVSYVQAYPIVMQQHPELQRRLVERR